MRWASEKHKYFWSALGCGVAVALTLGVGRWIASLDLTRRR